MHYLYDFIININIYLQIWESVAVVSLLVSTTLDITEVHC